MANIYKKIISLLESFKTHLPVTKTWMKLLVETEGSDIKIARVFDSYKFQKNNKWYHYYNKTIRSNDRVRTTDLFNGTKNLTFTDQNLYGYVNLNNEFYTILIVTKNYKKRN